MVHLVAGNPLRHSRTAQDKTLRAVMANSALGCQADSQIMTAVAIAVTARLMVSERPAWITPKSLSTQHITAAPGGTQAMRSAPTSAGQWPENATISKTATMLAQIPTTAVTPVRPPSDSESGSYRGS